MKPHVHRVLGTIAFFAGAMAAPSASRGNPPSAVPVDREAFIWSSPPGAASPDGPRTTRNQIPPNGSQLFLIPRVAAGAVPTTAMAGAQGPADTSAAGPYWRKELRSVVSVVNDRELFAFHFGIIQPPRAGIDPIYARSGYIDAIRTRAGAVISEAFPRLPEKHEHQYAMWSAWTATEFEGRTINFWDVKGGTAQIRCERISDFWEGPLAAGFAAVNVFHDRTVSPEKAVLRETWNVVAYRTPEELNYDLFDISLRQVCASSSPVTVKKNTYGGFSMHLPDAIYGESVLFMVSTGETDRPKANQRPQRWILYGRTLQRQAGGSRCSGPSYELPRAGAP